MKPTDTFGSTQVKPIGTGTNPTDGRHAKKGNALPHLSCHGLNVHFFHGHVAKIAGKPQAGANTRNQTRETRGALQAVNFGLDG